MKLLVIVPTRGRPENLAALEEARRHTQTTAGAVDFLYAVDTDDPKAVEYARAVQEYGGLWGQDTHLAIAPRRRMIGTLNFHAKIHAASGQYGAIGFMGDDHRPRTEGWDRHVLQALDCPEPRVVYGNDLIQGPNLPTAVFLHARIVEAAGFMAPGSLVHLYADNYWLELGRALAGLVYLPGTIIQHVHPVAGTAAWDDGYREVNAPQVDAGDRNTWERFVADGLLAQTVAKVQRAYTVAGVQL